MRICHFSDTHLGAGENHPRRGPSGLTLRQEDIIRSFVEVVDRIVDIRPDICIHSGDLFDSVRPLNSIMAVAARELHKLAVAHSIPTVIIAGNHDAPKQPHIGAAIEVFKQMDNLYIAAGGRLELYNIGNARIFALPHCLTISSLKEQLELCVPDPTANFNVLVAHGVVAGMPEFSMADLGEQELPRTIMQRFDYAALGHYHNHSQVTTRAYYAGSSERLSQAERDVAKGFAVVDLDPFRVEFSEIKCRSMLDLQTVDATGQRGDQVAALIKHRLEEIDASDKIVRLKVAGVTTEMLKTMPAETIAELKAKSFSLDICLEKDEKEKTDLQFGRSSIGQLDKAFVQYLESVDLTGFNLERLKKEALSYLTPED